MYACKHGDFVSLQARAVSGHANHHFRPRGAYFTGSRYDVETIKMILRLVKEIKQTNTRGFLAAAAIELNERGMKTVSGNEWTAGSVGNIWQTFRSKYRVHVPRKRDVAVSSTLTSTKSTDHVAQLDIALLDATELEMTLIDRLTELALDVTRYVESRRAHVCETATPSDQTLVENEELELLRRKARKWDTIFSLGDEEKS